MHFVGHPQRVRHLDDVDTIEESLVVAIVLESLPLGLVGVGEDQAVEGNRAEALGALVVLLLRRGQQGVQHLDRSLEHLDEFKNAAVGQAQAAGVRVGVRIVLRIGFQLADVDLADQRGNILVVLVARLGLGHGDLRQHRRAQANDAEAGDVAAEFLQALDRPRAHDAAQVTPGDAVILLEDGTVFVDVEQGERRLVHRRTLDRIERYFFDQRLQPFGQRGLATTDRSEEIENLLLFLQPLGCMAEVGNDVLDDLFHPVELAEGWVELEHLVGEDARQTGIEAGIDQFRLADGHQHALGDAGIGARIIAAQIQVFLDRQLLFLRRFIATLITREDRHGYLR